MTINWPLASPTVPEVDPENPDAPLPAGCPPCEALENLPATDKARVEAMAVDLLWNWTGRRYGLTEETVRPCRAECPSLPSTFWGYRAGLNTPSGSPWAPVLIDGQWFNLGCGTCQGTCRCAPDGSLALRLPGPAQTIKSVMIGGQELAEEAYELRDGVLYRIDGAAWPYCNDWVADPTAPDSPAWTITYERGYPVPDGGQIAAYTLACELALALCGDKACKLPQRVQSITRQGVTMAVLDSFEDVQDGRTGIWLVDAWVASVNAPRAARPQVYSPDIEPGRGTGLATGLGFGRTR